jgi:AAA domain
MDKIAIIGPSGAGKTTLAKKLGSRLGLKVYHLDRFFWQSSWRRESREIRIDRLQNLVQEKSWIIEGTYLNSSELHLQEANTIIFLDISPFVCLRRRIKRHREYKRHPGRDIPKGSTDVLTFIILLQILFFPFGARRKLEDKLSKFPLEKVMRLCSTKEIERFLAQLEIYTNEMRQSSSLVVNENSLILA